MNWDGRGLEVAASNSSLDQILHRVAALTGARLEGSIQDQRIFGIYGPGPGCEVLSKLLEGSGYNVLMIGSPDVDAPLEIVLTARSAASPQLAAKNRNSRSSDEDEAAKQPKPPPDDSGDAANAEPVQNPFSNGAPAPPDALQFMQDILQRQQKIDEQSQHQAAQKEKTTE